MSTRRTAAAAAALLTVLGSLTVASSAAAAPAANTRHVLKVGTGAYTPTGTGSGDPASISTELPRDAGPDAAGLAKATVRRAGGAHRSLAPTGAASAATKGSPSVAGGIVRNGPQLLTSFDGINHRQQRIANNGNQ